MGKEWDGWASPASFERWCRAWAAECLRVLKPGGMIVAFGGTRTFHRLACAIEDAGFEIRDSIAWLYAQGFPKSLDVSKAIDKAAGAERPSLGVVKGAASSNTASLGEFAPTYHATAPATPDAERWQGWGTALKPAFEPVVVARKPLVGTVASNVLAWGTGALNVDGCRISMGDEKPPTGSGGPNTRTSMAGGIMHGTGGNITPPAGRWPANVVLDEHAAAELDRQSGTSESRVGKPRGAAHGEGWGMTATGAEYADTGGASRFFYTTKAPSAERPRYSKSVLRLRAGLTPEQVGHVRARLAEAGVRVD